MPSSKVNLIFLPVIAVIAVGVMLTLTGMKNEDLSNSSNTTTFFQWSSCFSQLTSKICDDIQNDDSEKALCYQAGYEVGQYTYETSEEILDECQNFHSFSDKAQTSDMINLGDHYFNCYLSGEVLKSAYQSQYYYTQIYTPLYITCAGY